MRDEVARHLVASKLLVLQSKRLMLSSSQRRLDDTGIEALRARVDRLRAEIDAAQAAYRATMLEYGSPAVHHDFWTIAYGRLIEMGQALSAKLRSSVYSLPVAERYRVSADVEMLEEIVDRWTAAMRTAMVESVA